MEVTSAVATGEANPIEKSCPVSWGVAEEVWDTVGLLTVGDTGRDVDELLDLGELLAVIVCVDAEELFDLVETLLVETIDVKADVELLNMLELRVVDDEMEVELVNPPVLLEDPTVDENDDPTTEEESVTLDAVTAGVCKLLWVLVSVATMMVVRSNVGAAELDELEAVVIVVFENGTLLDILIRKLVMVRKDPSSKRVESILPWLPSFVSSP